MVITGWCGNRRHELWEIGSKSIEFAPRAGVCTMPEIGILILLYALGILVLVAEIFIPSSGVLCVTGMGLLVWAVARTFQIAGREAGVLAVLTCLVVLPIFAYVAIKYWHRTPIGKRIAPPNPVLTTADTSIPVEELGALIGQTGRCLSPLRPVGICEFQGRRISCLAEFGMIDAGTAVVGTRIAGANLAVIERKA